MSDFKLIRSPKIRAPWQVDETQLNQAAAKIEKTLKKLEGYCEELRNSAVESVPQPDMVSASFGMMYRDEGDSDPLTFRFSLPAEQDDEFYIWEANLADIAYWSAQFNAGGKDGDQVKKEFYDKKLKPFAEALIELGQEMLAHFKVIED